MPVLTALADAATTMWTFCTSPAGLVVLGGVAAFVAVVEVLDHRRYRRAR